MIDAYYAEMILWKQKCFSSGAFAGYDLYTAQDFGSWCHTKLIFSCKMNLWKYLEFLKVSFNPQNIEKECIFEGRLWLFTPQMCPIKTVMYVFFGKKKKRFQNCVTFHWIKN